MVAKAQIMSRILALDYGMKRTGIAVSDNLKISANGLETIETSKVFEFLDNYLKKETVETIVVGNPLTLQNTASDATPLVMPFVQKLKQSYPTIKVELFDERFTSKMAFQAMIAGGVKKQARRDKALVDKISAVILLQSYMESLNF